VFNSENLKGNQYAKKDMTKELAKAMVSKDLWYIAKLLHDIPAEDLKRYLKDNGVKLSLVATAIVDRAAKKDMKAIQWFCEMMVGKPKQEVDNSIKTDQPIKLVYAMPKKS
jgi:hypothetical protein